MVLKVYGLPVSPPCATVIMTAYEKGIDFELVTVNFGKREHKAPEYLLKHPFGKIPCIEDGDLTLFESLAIARYLSEKHAGQGTELYPAQPAQRAAVDQWMEVMAHWYDHPAAVLASERWYYPKFGGRPCNEAVAADSFRKLEAVADVYEAHLARAGNKYFGGDTFTLADVAHMPETNYLEVGAPEDFAKLVGSRKHLREWWSDVSARPAWKKYKDLAAEFMAKTQPKPKA